MKYVKQLLLFFVIGLLVFVFFYATTVGFSSLFIFPILFFSLFLGYYLYTQWQVDEEETMKKGVRYAVEDVAAEQWIKNDFAPHTLSIIKKKHWIILIYSFFIVGIFAFVWSYLSFGLSIAIRNFFYGAFLFWLFVAYIFGTQSWFLRLYRSLPQQLQVFLSGDWERAYFFLFPISFVIYLMYPFGTVWQQLLVKLSRFFLFFLIYTFVFLALYSLIYILEDMQNDEANRLKKKMEKFLRESSE